MWTVRILGTATYIPAPDGKQSLSGLPTTGWKVVSVYALDIEHVGEGELLKFSARQLRRTKQWWGVRMTLQSKLYLFPDEEPERRELCEVLVGSRYLWLDFGTYPAPLCSSVEAIAVELETLEVEHNHALGGKQVRATLWWTER